MVIAAIMQNLLSHDQQIIPTPLDDFVIRRYFYVKNRFLLKIHDEPDDKMI